jgi:hypothetical protein
LRAPAIDVLFRPEQEHGFSGEDNVFVPMPRRHGNVDDSLRPQQPACLHAKRYFVIAAAAGSVNPRILVQHGGNSQGIPDAVAVPSPLAGSDGKGRGHSRKWSGSPKFSGFLQDESMSLSQSLECGPDFAKSGLGARGRKRCRHLGHGGRSALADKMSIDVLAQASVESFRIFFRNSFRIFFRSFLRIFSRVSFRISGRAKHRLQLSGK